jgi:hypothetical protein
MRIYAYVNRRAIYGNSRRKEMPMKIRASVALVTGANRGLAAAFARGRRAGLAAEPPLYLAARA